MALRARAHAHVCMHVMARRAEWRMHSGTATPGKRQPCTAWRRILVHPMVPIHHVCARRWMHGVGCMIGASARSPAPRLRSKAPRPWAWPCTACAQRTVQPPHTLSMHAATSTRNGHGHQEHCCQSCHATTLTWLSRQQPARPRQGKQRSHQWTHLRSCTVHAVGMLGEPFLQWVQTRCPQRRIQAHTPSSTYKVLSTSNANACRHIKQHLSAAAQGIDGLAACKRWAPHLSIP